MKTTLTLAIAAVAASLAAGPVLAKDKTTTERQTTKTQKVKANKTETQARKPVRVQNNADATYERGFNNGFDRRAQMDRDRTAATIYDQDDDGFWPADVAGGIVGGAVGTAGTIASAPFRDTYASYDDDGPVVGTTVNSGWNNTYYDGGWNNNWNANWARRQSVERGGFICTPGTSYTNSYGYTQLCQ